MNVVGIALDNRDEYITNKNYDHNSYRWRMFTICLLDFINFFMGYPTQLKQSRLLVSFMGSLQKLNISEDHKRMFQSDISKEAE